MFDFGKKGENLTEAKIKEYFKENNFFGLQSFTKNFVVKNKEEQEDIKNLKKLSKEL